MLGGVKECSGGDDDGSGEDAAAVAELEAYDSLALSVVLFREQQVDDFGLLDEEAGLRLKHLAHLHAILPLVALGARRPDRGAARSIEQAELDPYGVGYLAHDSAERVDLANEMALGDTADGGVAGHLRDEVEIQREERCAQAHARGGDGGFAAGVPCADHDYFVLFRVCHVLTPILKEPEQSAREDHGCGESLRKQKIGLDEIAA
jgi:hypothetical protein